MRMLDGQLMVSSMLDAVTNALKHIDYVITLSIDKCLKLPEIIKVDRCFYAPLLYKTDGEGNITEHMAYLRESHFEIYQLILKIREENDRGDTCKVFRENYHDVDVERKLE
jgi:hypothetical protein